MILCNIHTHIQAHLKIEGVMGVSKYVNKNISTRQLKSSQFAVVGLSK